MSDEKAQATYAVQIVELSGRISDLEAQLAIAYEALEAVIIAVRPRVVALRALAEIDKLSGENSGEDQKT